MTRDSFASDSDEQDPEHFRDYTADFGRPRSPSVDRRSLLSAGAAALTLPVVGNVATATRGDEGYSPLGRYGFYDATEAVVDDAGEVAYVAADTSVKAVDLSDPTDLTKLSEVEIATGHSDGSLTGIQDAKVDGDRLIAGGPPGYADTFGGFGVVDVSDPLEMTEVAFTETSPDHGIHNCYLEGDIAYLTGTNSPAGGQSRLRIYDISDDDPEEIATWYPGDYDSGWDDVYAFLRNLHDVYVQDGIAYLSYWDAGVFLVDVSDPRNPEYISRFGDHTMEELQQVPQGDVNTEAIGPPGNTHYTTVNDDGTILGEGGESWAESPGDDSGPSPITLYDISDPANPEELASVSPEETGNNTQRGYWSTSHNFEIRGDKLYSSWYHAGVKIHDISDPSNPEQIAWYANPDEMSFWTAQVGIPGEFFVATTFRGAPRTSDSALYTFPDEAGEMESPPQFPALQEDDSENTTTEPSDGQATTAQPTDAPTTATTRSEQGTETMGGDGTTTSGDGSGGSPGLGILSGLAGLGIGAWRLTRDREK